MYIGWKKGESLNLFLHAVRSKGRVAFIRRIGSIVSRFGVTTAKTDANFRGYLETLDQFGCSATFPITGVILERHPALIRRMSEDGVEFAVHGYVHTDHTGLSEDEQRLHMARALGVFRTAGITAEGFRSPYLRGNEDTISAARSLGFQYISNEVISYDVLDRNTIKPARWVEYLKALNLYSALPSSEALARPRLRGDLIEIPVSMPDDEILMDRLGFADPRSIGKVWADLVDLTYAGGDLLTLQLHPERGNAFREALAIALSRARQKQPMVWVAQLRDIAAWWRRRAAFKLRVEPAGNKRWRIVGPNERDAAVLLKNLTCLGAKPWYGQYLTLDDGECMVECEQRPVIGVGPNCHTLRALLEEEGYAVSSDGDPAQCALYLDRPGALNLAEQSEIVREIERSPAPLVRIGRWPKGMQSAMSVTGDIDALTLGDFFTRAWEVR
jgi:peptidoglycan/xylan/chitin deacetylase (PgdA/CDA1 family)